MERKERVIYDSITEMSKEEMTRFLAMVAPTWATDEERCFADRDFACTSRYAESLIAKYLDCPIEGLGKGTAHTDEGDYGDCHE